MNKNTLLSEDYFTTEDEGGVAVATAQQDGRGQSPSVTTDHIIHATAADDTVRCIAAVTTNTVGEAAERHLTSGTATAALGRTLTGALLLGSTLKELDRLTVQIIGDGDIGSITAEANANGEVRGYVRNPDADAPLNANGKFDVARIVGNGMLYVIRESGYDIGLYKEPYRGSIPILSGEIAEDFAHYLTQSEQIPSGVMLSVLVRASEAGAQFVEAAGGVMIQMMPNADEETIVAVERAASSAPQLSRLIQSGASAEDLLSAALGDMELKLMEQKPVRFACPCSYERAVSLISSIDRATLQEMKDEDKGAVMTCHFCNESYRLSEEKLDEILLHAS